MLTKARIEFEMEGCVQDRIERLNEMKSSYFSICQQCGSMEANPVRTARSRSDYSLRVSLEVSL